MALERFSPWGGKGGRELCYSRRPYWFRGLTGLTCGGAGGWLSTVGRSNFWAEGVGREGKGGGGTVLQ